MLDDTSRIASIIGSLSRQSDSLSSNISPDDAYGLLSIFNTEFANFTGGLVVSALVYSSTGFFLDHPVYGVLDDTGLLLDGTYASTSTVLVSEVF
jgi:hypothetical protein